MTNQRVINMIAVLVRIGIYASRPRNEQGLGCRQTIGLHVVWVTWCQWKIYGHVRAFSKLTCSVV